MTLRSLGIIPARGGSKGIPRKNIFPLLGQPLIAYSIKPALACAQLTDVIVSTEDDEIAAVAREFGAVVPFKRPAELATDTALSIDVVRHTVQEMETLTGVLYDIIVLLQPTCPLRTVEDIENGITRLIETGADSLVSVVEVGGHHPFRMKRIVGDNQLINFIDQGFEDMRPRQELPPVYLRSGDLYIAQRHVVMEQHQMVGADCRAYVISPERAVNIDTPFDLILAEYMLKQMESSEA